ncbi:MAG: MerR family transcriptional regulator [Azospirillaceae bacterium]
MAHYGLSAAMAASGASQSNIRDWQSRGYFGGGLSSTGRGRARRYSTETIYELALMKYLSDLGLTPRLGGHAVGDDIGGKLLRATGHTVMLCYPSAPGASRHVRPGGIEADALFRHGPVVVAIDTEAIRESVDAKLAEFEPLPD